MTTNASDSRFATRLASGASIGFVLGLIVGLLVAGGTWLWVLAQGLNGSEFSLPGAIRVYAEGQSVYTEVGPLLLLLPLLAGIICGLVVAGLAGLEAFEPSDFRRWGEG